MFDRKNLVSKDTKKWVRQKTWLANKRGGTNTKLGGPETKLVRPVPGRPTRRAATVYALEF